MVLAGSRQSSVDIRPTPKRHWNFPERNLKFPSNINTFSHPSCSVVNNPFDRIPKPTTSNCHQQHERTLFTHVSRSTDMPETKTKQQNSRRKRQQRRSENQKIAVLKTAIFLSPSNPCEIRIKQKIEGEKKTRNRNMMVQQNRQQKPPWKLVDVRHSWHSLWIFVDFVKEQIIQSLFGKALMAIHRWGLCCRSWGICL